MMRNEQAILKLKAHLHMVFGLANDLNGEYGPAASLKKMYGEAFNHITCDLMPQMGMTEDEIVDLISSLDKHTDLGYHVPGIVRCALQCV